MLVNIIALYALSAPEVAATAPTKVTTPTIVFDAGCETIQTPDNPKEWVLRMFSPAALIGIYYNNIRRPEPDLSKAQVRVSREAKHGRINPVSEESAKKVGLSYLGGPIFSYLPRKGYLGPDDVTFVVKLEGKNYEIRRKFYVVWQINDDDWYEEGTPATLCAQSEYRRIAGSFTSGGARLFG